MEEKLSKIVENLKKHISKTPEIGIIAGRGLGKLIDSLEGRVSINFEDAGIKLLGGDKGKFYIGSIGDRGVIIAYGRLHSYNGYDRQSLVLPVYIFEKLGCKTLLLSCAGGAVKRGIKVGDIVAATDHINLSGNNPLCGNFTPYGQRFVDLSDAYSPRLLSIAKQCGKELGIKVRRGVFIESLVPSGETAAEVKMAGKMGGSVLGFHAVSEVIAARYAGLEVFAAFFITNHAGAFAELGIDRNFVDHNRDTAENYNSEFFIKLIQKL